MKYLPHALAIAIAALCAYKAFKSKGDKRLMWGVASGVLLVGTAGYAYATREPEWPVDQLIADDYVAPPAVQQQQAIAMENKVASLPLPPEQKASLMDQVGEIAMTAATDYAKEQMIRELPGMTESVANSLIDSFKAESGGGGGAAANQPYVPPKASTGTGKDQSQELATYMRQSAPGAYEIVVKDGARQGEVLAEVFYDKVAGYAVGIKASNFPPGISLWSNPDKSKAEVPPQDKWPAWEFLMGQLKSRGVKDKTPA